MNRRGRATLYRELDAYLAFWAEARPAPLLERYPCEAWRIRSAWERTNRRALPLQAGSRRVQG